MKTYLIIGGSSGIGEALVKRLQQNNNVLATYRTKPPVTDSANLIFHELDVTKTDADFSFIPEKLDGLVYCPGTIVLKPFQRFTAADFLNDYNIQVAGAVKVMQAALPALKASGAGSILLFSTVAASKGFPFHAVVSASKGAIEGLTRSLAAELSPGIRVNCIAPSITDTPLAQQLLSTDEKRAANAGRHALKRIGTANDIAAMAHFLLSDDASWITGQVIHVDGGLSAT